MFVAAQHSRGTPPNNDTQKENGSVGRRSFLKITTHIRRKFMDKVLRAERSAVNSIVIEKPFKTKNSH